MDKLLRISNFQLYLVGLLIFSSALALSYDDIKTADINPEPYYPVDRNLVPDIDRSVRLRSALIFLSRYQQLMLRPVESQSDLDQLVKELNRESILENGYRFRRLQWQANGKTHLNPPPGISRSAFFKIMKAVDNYRIAVKEINGPEDEAWSSRVPKSDLLFQTELQGKAGLEYFVFEGTIRLENGNSLGRQRIYFDPPDPHTEPEGLELTYRNAFQVFWQVDPDRNIWVRPIWTDDGRELSQYFLIKNSKEFEVGFRPPDEPNPWLLPLQLEVGDLARWQGPYAVQNPTNDLANHRTRVRQNFEAKLAQYELEAKSSRNLARKEQINTRIKELNLMWSATFGD